jgi:hypothetical protein
VAFGTFVTPLVSAPGKIHTLHYPPTRYATDTLFALPPPLVYAEVFDINNLLIFSPSLSIIYV